jgi:hypothetical protein
VTDLTSEQKKAALRLDRHCLQVPIRCQFLSFRGRSSDQSPDSARTVFGTIAQLGEPPPCKRAMRVQVPLVSTIEAAEPKPHSSVSVFVRDRAIPNSSEEGFNV